MLKTLKQKCRSTFLYRSDWCYYISCCIWYQI